LRVELLGPVDVGGMATIIDDDGTPVGGLLDGRGRVLAGKTQLAAGAV